MRVLVVGGGGREHAICRALQTGSVRPELVIAPGNAGTARLGRNVAVNLQEPAQLVAVARQEHAELVIVGPEQPLVLGLVDRLEAAGIRACGPKMAAAKIEGSKAHLRELAASANVPGPAFAILTEVHQVARAVGRFAAPPVVKADGLAAGKGVFLPATHEECIAQAEALLAGSLGDAGRTVVLEERLTGVEASAFFVCDGDVCVRWPSARDHKRLRDGDQGPNTGGMGAVSPNPALDDDTLREIEAQVVRPTLAALARRGTPYSGFLFAGLMLCERRPMLLEFNARLGDPETQAILPRLPAGAFLELADACSRHSLRPAAVAEDPRVTCAVVLAAAGYPERSRLGDPVDIEPGLESADRWLDYSGIKAKNGRLVTSGGRVATVVARADSSTAAGGLAYRGVAMVRFAGAQHRRDIGGR
ncbi:MAG: phosphoribosylamine--glycine ligase [Deltaproteobacteria bacterium]|nr:phosphoribosylamine--glycine ligase [Deltaproteobacteria bacterium]